MCTKQCELALVVGAARSGTTLTRLLLDAHPEIGCPSEAGIPALMAHMARVWSTVNADELARREHSDPGVRPNDGDAPARWEQLDNDRGAEPHAPPAAHNGTVPLSAEARAWITRAVQMPMSEYCEREEKRIYCDKSLDSVYHLELVRELFPTVRTVLVVRHVMDTVASGIEASPWGFQAYGYAPYVQAQPGNSVAALASYWLDHVSLALRWEKEHPDLCYRVRYEDLVLAPDAAVAGIQRFLGVEENLSVLSGAFEREPARGPGDYKVEYTAGVHAASIGRGKRVPVTMLPPPLLAALNEKLEALGYESLGQSWNAAERLVDGGGQGLWAIRLRQLMSDVRVAAGRNPTVASLAIVAEDHRSLRWVIEPDAGTVTQGDGEVEGVLTGTAEDLVMMLDAEENLGVLIRSGRIRFVVAEGEEPHRRDVMSELNKIVRLLRTKSSDPRASVLT